MRQLISIKQGDSTVLTETITGLDSLAGFTAKMYIVDKAGAEVATITGVIDGLEIAYDIVNEASKLYPVDIHDFETKIFNASDQVFTPTSGKFEVKPSIEEDPS